eukprot:8704871-Pyramimonas_sp.AAC.1
MKAAPVPARVFLILDASRILISPSRNDIQANCFGQPSVGARGRPWEASWLLGGVLGRYRGLLGKMLESLLGHP